MAESNPPCMTCVTIQKAEFQLETLQDWLTHDKTTYAKPSSEKDGWHA